jgi:glutamate 5-kinase
VRVIGPDGDELARGLTSYKSSDLQEIMGHNSSEIEGILGYSGSDWVIHRDDLVIDKHR